MKCNIEEHWRLCVVLRSVIVCPCHGFSFLLCISQNRGKGGRPLRRKVGEIDFFLLFCIAEFPEVPCLVQRFLPILGLYFGSWINAGGVENTAICGLMFSACPWLWDQRTSGVEAKPWQHPKPLCTSYFWKGCGI